ncbi:MAG: amidohydrolase family protein [Microvirga sp.]
MDSRIGRGRRLITWGSSARRIEIFGPSRALFASNFPVARMRVNYHRWVAAVERALEGFASDDRVAVFAGNAMHICQIETNESTA